MKILSIDSSSSPASVAILENDAPIGEFTININRTHSEKLLPITDMLTDILDITVSDIDVFAISAGPGSFTGLRIGMSEAKLLAETSGKPLISVRTLEALAENVSVFSGYICPVLDARNSTVYCAIYECENGIIKEVLPTDAMNVSELAAKLSALDKAVLVTGEYAKYKDIFSSASDRISFAPKHLASQSAVSVGIIAYREYLEGVRTLPSEVQPFYVRESQAEQAKRAKEAKK